jgi:uncharacterized lipoprotein YddW (UPF0748 family)
MLKVNRREFLTATASTGLGLALPGRMPTVTSFDSPTLTRLPKRKMKYWIWTGIDRKASANDLNAKYAKLREHGLTGVFISGGVDDREFDIIKAHDLEIHSWMWTTNRGDEWIRKNHPDWYMVSRTGKSCFDQPPYVDYYRWVSPVIPGVQSYLKDRVAELAKHPAITGVHLDYVRYPDVILPKDLWKQYKVDQREEMPEYDFCYSEHTRKAFKAVSGRDPMDIEDPAHDQEWLKFRYDSVTHLVKQLTEVAHHHHKQITAAVFPTPSQARKICRQDWDKWPLDAFCPMIYHSFYEEDVEWIGDCMRENIQAVSAPIYAGLYVPAFQGTEDIRRAVQLVKKRGGAGVSLFAPEHLSPEQWSAIGEVATASS